MTNAPLELTLVSDCASCFGLCCVALPFAASRDFGADKAAGEPCRNLVGDSGCRIHDQLRETGWRGCTVFECFGAGQQVSQQTYARQSWRDHPESAGEMFATFAVMRQVQEMRWLVAHAARRSTITTQQARLAQHETRLADLAASEPAALLATDLAALRGTVAETLREVSALLRTPSSASHRAAGQHGLKPGADLMGRDLSGLDLRGTDLRGALLVAANLSGADLRTADLLGADVRDANLSDADLSEVLYLTQPQVNAAVGNGRTRLPPELSRPGQW
ncbi:MAG: pentapeptide repeat-containing protein [Propionibacteriales bacterium]|nr:pentapeptide repeat-containing protein [Propionibacteriales bacterium]